MGLETVEEVMALEQAFDLPIPDEEADKLFTPRQHGGLPDPPAHPTTSQGLTARLTHCRCDGHLTGVSVKMLVKWRAK
ncbi:MAG: hypothetical protein ACI9TH_001309 [Kiritimatiellia bacterium]|jgi:hypothetical protein